MSRVATILKRVILGSALPQQCIVGMSEPQTEIAVELHGCGEPIDVTQLHAPACAAPFQVAIGGRPGWRPEAAGPGLALHFRERGGRQRCLGLLELEACNEIDLEPHAIYCFSVRRGRNYCVTKPRMWARQAQWAYRRWRRPPDVSVSGNDATAMAIFFICPRPVVLVSAERNGVGNLFPMNLMGSLGKGYFGFALNHTRPSASLVESAGRLALSSVPIEMAPMVRGMGNNHRRESIDWSEVPFPLRRSSELALQVPESALRVRELELMGTHKMGSHTLFLARILRDEHWRDGDQFFMLHGIYQACRNGSPSLT